MRWTKINLAGRQNCIEGWDGGKKARGRTSTWETAAKSRDAGTRLSAFSPRLSGLHCFICKMEIIMSDKWGSL